MRQDCDAVEGWALGLPPACEDEACGVVGRLPGPMGGQPQEVLELADPGREEDEVSKSGPKMRASGVQMPLNLRYLNNHVSQRKVRDKLIEHGLSEAGVKLIDFDKQQFPGELFLKVYPDLRHNDNWPKV